VWPMPTFRRHDRVEILSSFCRLRHMTRPAAAKPT
jgi:hypothetical protein